MAFLITTGAGYSLTNQALNLINFFSQLFVFFGTVICGLIVINIVLTIFKP